jgi:hypothetical protein
MIHLAHQVFFYFHVIVGSFALVGFWLPLIAKKGTKRHILSGKFFAWCMYIVSITGIVMTLMALAMPLDVYAIDPGVNGQQLQHTLANIRSSNSFLFMLSLLVFCTTHHALMVVRFKHNRSGLKTVRYLTPVILLLIVGITVISLAIQQSNPLFLAFGVISSWASAGMLYYIFKPEVGINDWLLEHFGGLIGSGIGAYTAFFAFGGRRFMNEILSGQLQLIPWLLPAVIGVSATAYLNKKYRSKQAKPSSDSRIINEHSA